MNLSRLECAFMLLEHSRSISLSFINKVFILIVRSELTILCIWVNLLLASGNFFIEKYIVMSPKKKKSYASHSTIAEPIRLKKTTAEPPSVCVCVNMNYQMHLIITKQHMNWLPIPPVRHPYFLQSTPDVNLVRSISKKQFKIYQFGFLVILCSLSELCSYFQYNSNKYKIFLLVF